MAIIGSCSSVHDMRDFSCIPHLFETIQKVKNMFNLDGLKDQFKHMQWADATVWRAVLELPATEIDTALRDLLYHIHMVQYAFLCIWQDAEADYPEISSFADDGGLLEWGRKNYGLLEEYLDDVDPSAVTREVLLPWAQHILKRLGRPPGATTLGETMAQVIAHSAYHRGQVNARIRSLSSEPPLVDYIAWIWLGRPEARWPNSA